MNIRTDRQTDRQTDRIHRYHVYVGLTQARPDNLVISLDFSFDLPMHWDRVLAIFHLKSISIGSAANSGISASLMFRLLTVYTVPDITSYSYMTKPKVCRPKCMGIYIRQIPSAHVISNIYHLWHSLKLKATVQLFI